MPIWAYVYCTFILLAGIGTAILNSHRSKYYLPGEILSVISCISFFLFHYEKLEKPSSLLVPLALAAYVVYWEGWENRHHYFSGIPKKEPGRSLYLKRKKGEFITIGIFVVIVSTPLLFVATEVISSYVT